MLQRTVVLLLFIGVVCAAQQALNNDSIVRMAKAGLSDTLMVTTINAQPGQYDISVNGIIALKTAGVSDTVVAALLARAAKPAPCGVPAAGAAPVAAQPPSNPDDPNSPHEPGIYLFSGAAGTARMTEIEPSLYEAVGAGTYTSLHTAHASIHAPGANLVLYLYMDNNGANHSRSYSLFGDIASGNEVVMLKFKVGRNSRSVMLTDDHPTLADSVRLRPGVYKITPRQPLAPGEYGIFPVSATLSYRQPSGEPPRCFDFGVD